MPITPQAFIAKWKQADLSERSACQQHFLDLCELLGQPKPAEVDPTGHWYTFEKGVEKTDGGKGFADVWMQDRFGWDYKGRHKNLKAAYEQLLKYREALENPPLLIVCDLDRFEIHTNYTGTIKKVYAFDLDGLADPANILLLRHVFTNPEVLKPGKTQAAITEEIAGRFAILADGMTARGIAPQQAAHFLMKLMFCMFAEDIELLPRDLFSRTVANAKNDPARLSKLLRNLFESMAKGEPFGADQILWFNGGLFADSDTIALTPPEIAELVDVARTDWSSVEPSIFGTLFERTLDPTKRSQIGAHYTSRADIETVLRPVLLDPFRREWEETKKRAEALWEKVQAEARQQARKRRTDSKSRRDFDKCVRDFVDRLNRVTILDPACGSGNFLYVAINLLLDLEKEVLTYAANHDVSQLAMVRPSQLHGLEINTYAQQLAQVVLWIGYLQWMYFNGYQPSLDPVLETFETIRNIDSILDLTDPAKPKEPEWPEAEFIVGNPPFLGNKLMRSMLGERYVEALWKLYGDRLPAMSDLCCYWFEKARAMLDAAKAKRVGLLGTTAMKQVGSRHVLERICETGRVFFAESDREWMLDGAAVRTVMVGYEASIETAAPVHDGKNVARINADLTAGLNVAAAGALASNANRCFMGTTKVGAFDIDHDAALGMLRDPNPQGVPNSDVLRPWVNGSDIVRNPSNRWIIDFGTDRPEAGAAQYSNPFEYLTAKVKQVRQHSGQKDNQEYWWIHARPRPAMRKALHGSSRYIGTARVAKHRIFVWLDTVVLSDSKVIAIAFDDDFHFGLLQSRVHEVWTLALCGWHGKGNDATYNPNTCFLTFPFPDASEDQRSTIAATAKELEKLRNNWLNPPEWTKQEILEFLGSAQGPWARYIHEADAHGIGTVRYPRWVPKDDKAAADLKKRTLTNLYNQRPTWLDLAHKKLDAAVFAAYGWSSNMTDDDILTKLLELNLARAERKPRPQAEPSSEDGRRRGIGPGSPGVRA